MTTDTSRTLVIESSRKKLLLLVGLGVLMTAASTAIAVGLWPDSPLDKIAGYFGTAFFGLCTAVALWRLVRSRGPVVTISPEGIRDTRIAAAFIPWSAVTGISTWELYGQKIMVLAIRPGAEKRLGLTAIARLTRGANRALGADGLCITASGLKIDHDSLLAISQDYAQGTLGKVRRDASPASSALI